MSGSVAPCEKCDNPVFAKRGSVLPLFCEKCRGKS